MTEFKHTTVLLEETVEIWNKARWEETIEETEENFDDIAENLIDFGL